MWHENQLPLMWCHSPLHNSFLDDGGYSLTLSPRPLSIENMSCIWNRPHSSNNCKKCSAYEEISAVADCKASPIFLVHRIFREQTEWESERVELHRWKACTDLLVFSQWCHIQTTAPSSIEIVWGRSRLWFPWSGCSHRNSVGTVGKVTLWPPLYTVQK